MKKVKAIPTFNKGDKQIKKNYTTEQREWLDLKELFDEEFENFETISPDPSQTRDEMYEGLGRHYDAVFKDNTGISIEDFVQKHRSHYTFSEIVRHRRKGEVTERIRSKAKRKGLSQQDKLAIRLKTNLVAEKGIGYSIMLNKEVLDMNYKAFWIADCVAWAITQQYGVEFDDKEKNAIIKSGVKTLQDLKNFYSDLKSTNPEQYDLKCQVPLRKMIVVLQGIALMIPRLPLRSRAGMFP